MIVETDQEAIALGNRLGYFMLIGDATSDQVLTEAGIARDRYKKLLRVRYSIASNATLRTIESCPPIIVSKSAREPTAEPIRVLGGSSYFHTFHHLQKMAFVRPLPVHQLVTRRT